MDLINSYFDNIVFVKYEIKEEFTLYLARLHFSSNSYAVAVVPNHLALLSKGFLKELYWSSLVIKKMDKKCNIKQQVLRPSRTLPNIMFVEIYRDDKRVKYLNEEYSLELMLLNDAKKKSVYQYPKHYNLHAAINLCNTVITPIDNTL